MTDSPIVSRQDAEQYVAGALGDHAPDFDVPGVLDELWDAYRGWDGLSVPDAFWAAIERHAR